MSFVAAAAGRRSATRARAARPGSSRASRHARGLVHGRARRRACASMSMPWSAAGKRPTAESSEVRPPTQSHIGKRASQPVARRVLVELAALAGDGDGVLAEVEARRARTRPAPRACRCASPCVPPRLEMTTVERLGERVADARRARGRCRRDRCCRRSTAACRSRGVAERVGDELRARAPSRRCRSTSTFVKRRRALGRDRAGVHVARRSRWMRASVVAIAVAQLAASGASSGARSQ